MIVRHAVEAEGGPFWHEGDTHTITPWMESYVHVIGLILVLQCESELDMHHYPASPLGSEQSRVLLKNIRKTEG